uniref:Double homeobox B-like 1 n=1 Tax=Jaculus jaculus TaxID=51337 RepID=A0A8C5LD86_JACJA
EARRRRIILSQSQKDTLCAWFEKNPYPDIATRGQLAKEIGISESQILTWFQKHRKNQKRLEWEGSLEECQSQGQEKPHFKAKELGRPRTHFTKFQTDILVEAFEKNRFPGIATREELAKRTGLPESRIHARCPSICPSWTCSPPPAELLLDNGGCLECPLCSGEKKLPWVTIWRNTLGWQKCTH